jgi:predicted DsbA family dithiol-disulfide isomerase
MSTTVKRLQLDIISDFVCPWCFIGKRKLDVALQRDMSFEINLVWRPYRLDPRLPAGGVDRDTYMKQKFGATAMRGITDKIKAAAEGTGIHFNFEAIKRTPNTTNAHRLTRWAGFLGKQHAVAEDLFVAYFEQGLDIGNDEVLIDIGMKHGFNPIELAASLSGADDIDLIDNQDAQARNAGVTGVPALLMGGKFLLMGAQDPDYLNMIFSKAVEKLENPSATIMIE